MNLLLLLLEFGFDASSITNIIQKHASYRISFKIIIAFQPRYYVGYTREHNPFS